MTNPSPTPLGQREEGPPEASCRGKLPVANWQDHGIWWARGGAIGGGLVSVAGNVLDARAQPVVHPGAVFGAVFWPVCLLAAVEVFALPLWGTGFWSWILRVVVNVPIAVVAAVTSYHHLSGLLVMWEEYWFTARFGPVAIDGLMLSCAAALFRARAGAAEGSSRGLTAGSVSPPPGAHEPAPAGLTEPADNGLSEPVREPGGRAHDEPGEPAVVSPFRRPTRNPKPAADGLMECTTATGGKCRAPGCSGRVSKATRSRHRGHAANRTAVSE